MDPQITTYIQSLAIAATQADLVRKILEDDYHGAVVSERKDWSDAVKPSIAVAVMKIILGEAKVSSMPADETSEAQNWSQTCWKTPSCIVTAENSHDVSLVLKTIRFFQLKFAVRSGGHSPNPGWSSIDGPGVLLDLKKMNQLSVSDDRTVVSIGPGKRWGEVYEALDPYELSVVGGRIPQVGVGGLILGGGLFHFSGRYGLAADNVQSFEVVLADGSIVNANTQNNSDLFWALKGGGPNFGIVTKFDMYTVPVHKIWFTVSVYHSNDAEACIDAFTEWQETNSPDTKSTVALVIGLASITVGLFYADTAVPSNVFAAFEKLPAPLVVAVPPSHGTLNTLTQILASVSATDPMRHDYRGASSRIDAQLYKDVYAVWREKAIAVNSSTGANMTFVLQHIHAGMTASSNAAGGNPMGIPDVAHQWWTTLVDWKNAEDDAAVRAVSIATTEAWEVKSKDRGLEIPYIFMNDASRDQNPLAGYGASNVQKLKNIAAKYDPDGVFQNMQSGGFLLKDV